MFQGVIAFSHSFIIFYGKILRRPVAIVDIAGVLLIVNVARWNWSRFCILCLRWLLYKSLALTRGIPLRHLLRDHIWQIHCLVGSFHRTWVPLRNVSLNWIHLWFLRKILRIRMWMMLMLYWRLYNTLCHRNLLKQWLLYEGLGSGVWQWWTRHYLTRLLRIPRDCSSRLGNFRRLSFYWSSCLCWFWLLVW